MDAKLSQIRFQSQAVDLRSADLKIMSQCLIVQGQGTKFGLTTKQGTHRSHLQVPCSFRSCHRSQLAPSLCIPSAMLQGIGFHLRSIWELKDSKMSFHLVFWGLHKIYVKLMLTSFGGSSSIHAPFSAATHEQS